MMRLIAWIEKTFADLMQKHRRAAVTALYVVAMAAVIAMFVRELMTISNL